MPVIPVGLRPGRYFGKTLWRKKLRSDRADGIACRLWCWHTIVCRHEIGTSASKSSAIVGRIDLTIAVGWQLRSQQFTSLGGCLGRESSLSVVRNFGTKACFLSNLRIIRSAAG